MVFVLALLLAACGAEDADGPTATPESGSAGQETGERTTIVISNVDSSNPAQKIEEFQPLADYLAANLEDSGITIGEVVVARDTSEMARMMSDGESDLYIDAAIPSLEVCEESGCIFALEQWKGGTATLAGVFITTEDSGVASLEDLQGKVIMLEQPHSTVGHILPLLTLEQAGITTVTVDSPEAEVGEDEVGYYVSSGGQTSMNLLLNGEIAAMAIGERAYRQFSPDVQEQVTIFAETIGAPSQIVSFRSDLDPELQEEIVRLMVELDETEEGQAILVAMRETEKFEEIPDDVVTDLEELYEVVKQTLQS